MCFSGLLLIDDGAFALPTLDAIGIEPPVAVSSNSFCPGSNDAAPLTPAGASDAEEGTAGAGRFSWSVQSIRVFVRDRAFWVVVVGESGVVKLGAGGAGKLSRIVGCFRAVRGCGKGKSEVEFVLFDVALSRVNVRDIVSGVEAGQSHAGKGGWGRTKDASGPVR